jgi:hypothetical protein
MYVNPQALTFDDLAAAVHRDSGLGQIVAGCTDTSDPSCLPLSTPMGAEMAPAASNYNPFAVQLAAAGATAGSGIGVPPLALILGGGLLLLFAFGLGSGR